MFNHAWNLYRLFWLHNGNVAFIIHALLPALYLFIRWQHPPRLYHRRIRRQRGDYYDQNRNYPEDDQNGNT